MNCNIAMKTFQPKKLDNSDYFETAMTTITLHISSCNPHHVGNLFGCCTGSDIWYVQLAWKLLMLHARRIAGRDAASQSIPSCLVLLEFPGVSRTPVLACDWRLCLYITPYLFIALVSSTVICNLALERYTLGKISNFYFLLEFFPVHV